MPVVAAVAAIGAGAAVAKSVIGSNASKSAANAQQAAADQAAAIQADAKTQALDLSGKATAQARADLQPYNAAGTQAIGGLQAGLEGVSNLVTNPNAQKDYITNNPFFDALSKRASTTLLNNAATKGKLASGNTAEALQNSILLLGSDLVNQNITQRQNTNNQYQALVNTGLSAAGTQANVTNSGANRDVSTVTGVANNQSNLRQDSGDAQAAGIMGSASARNNGIQGVANVATSAIGQYNGMPTQTNGSISLCDVRAKENISEVGKLKNGLPIYKFNYKGDNKTHLNVMAQDVEEVNPSAVTEINGFKYINMEKVCQ